jgi:t-SNARE complex subunit (syntaxin)
MELAVERSREAAEQLKKQVCKHQDEFLRQTEKQKRQLQKDMRELQRELMRLRQDWL